MNRFETGEKSRNIPVPRFQKRRGATRVKSEIVPSHSTDTTAGPYFTQQGTESVSQKLRPIATLSEDVLVILHNDKVPATLSTCVNNVHLPTEPCYLSTAFAIASRRSLIKRWEEMGAVTGLVWSICRSYPTLFSRTISRSPKQSKTFLIFLTLPGTAQRTQSCKPFLW